jgi:hypothetical protein
LCQAPVDFAGRLTQAPLQLVHLAIRRNSSEDQKNRGGSKLCMQLYEDTTG